MTNLEKSILVFGSNGMLGHYVSAILPTARALTRKDYDILGRDEVALERLLTDPRPDVVINCAGLIKQRSSNPDELRIVNTEFPLLLGRICKTYGIHLLHITTDCVYDGKRGNYTEKDPHTATDDYGLSKSQGEACAASPTTLPAGGVSPPEAVVRGGTRTSILRTSIIGHETDGRSYSLLEWALSSSGPVKGFSNHYWNGVTCLQLAYIIRDIISKGLWWQGVQHVHSPETMSKYELVKLIRKIYGHPGEVEAVTVEPVNRSLRTLYPLQEIVIPPLEEQIEAQRKWQENSSNSGLNPTTSS